MSFFVRSDHTDELVCFRHNKYLGLRNYFRNDRIVVTIFVQIVVCGFRLARRCGGLLYVCVSLGIAVFAARRSNAPDTGGSNCGCRLQARLKRLTGGLIPLLGGVVTIN